jgi:23S rRNA G2445 N2-methylase RlmL
MPGKRGVSFLASESTAYRVLLWSRIANSVWELLAERQSGVRSRRDLYSLVAGLDWDEYMTVDQTVG